VLKEGTISSHGGHFALNCLQKTAGAKLLAKANEPDSQLVRNCLLFLFQAKREWPTNELNKACVKKKSSHFALQKPGRVFGEKGAIYKGRVRFPFRAAVAS
jgi:hypothetical protein